jgi:hypothetical protein
MIVEPIYSARVLHSLYAALSILNINSG